MELAVRLIVVLDTGQTVSTDGPLPGSAVSDADDLADYHHAQRYLSASHLRHDLALFSCVFRKIFSEPANAGLRHGNI